MNLNDDDYIILDTLRFLAVIKKKLGTFCHSLEAEDFIIETTSNVECHQYEDKLYLSIWFEAEFVFEYALTWWVDIIFDEDHWILDAQISWNGRDIIVAFPEETTSSFKDIENLLPDFLDKMFDLGKQNLNARPPDFENL